MSRFCLCFKDHYISYPGLLARASRPLFINTQTSTPFLHQNQSSTSKTPGSIKLLFYTPKAYKTLQSIGFPSQISSRRWKGYPILIDFHGEGFAIGKASEDARRATAVAEHNSPSKGAVVISVSYRLAPEHPSPQSPKTAPPPSSRYRSTAPPSAST